MIIETMYTKIMIIEIISNKITIVKTKIIETIGSKITIIETTDSKTLVKGVEEEGGGIEEDITMIKVMIDRRTSEENERIDSKTTSKTGSQALLETNKINGSTVKMIRIMENGMLEVVEAVEEEEEDTMEEVEEEEEVGTWWREWRA